MLLHQATKAGSESFLPLSLRNHCTKGIKYVEGLPTPIVHQGPVETSCLQGNLNPASDDLITYSDTADHFH